MESLGELEDEPLGELGELGEAEGELEEGSLFIREDSPEGLLMESPELAAPGVVVAPEGFFFIASPVFFFFSAGFVVGDD
jgi:hypothetical protein